MTIGVNVLKTSAWVIGLMGLSLNVHAAPAAAAKQAASMPASAPAKPSAQFSPAVEAGRPAAMNTVLASGAAGTITVDDVRMMAEAKFGKEKMPAFWKNREGVLSAAVVLYHEKALAKEALASGMKVPEEAAKEKRAVARDALIAKAWLDAQAARVQPDEAALDGYARSQYNAQADRFDAPDRYRVRHILVGVKQGAPDEAKFKAQANDLLKQLRAGADFEALAKKVSNDEGSARRGGDLGFLDKGQMAPGLEEAVLKLKNPGDLTEVFQTSFGYHVAQLVEHRAPGKRGFDEVAPALRAEAAQKIDGRERRALWDQAGLGMEVNESALSRVLAHGVTPTP